MPGVPGRGLRGGGEAPAWQVGCEGRAGPEGLRLLHGPVGGGGRGRSGRAEQQLLHLPLGRLEGVVLLAVVILPLQGVLLSLPLAALRGRLGPGGAAVALILLGALYPVRLRPVGREGVGGPVGGGGLGGPGEGLEPLPAVGRLAAVASPGNSSGEGGGGG